MSPAEKHKQRVQRKRSLKALRNVVTPKNSPRVKSRRSHGAASSSDGGKTLNAYDGASVAASSSFDRTSGPSSSSGSRYQNPGSSVPVAKVVNGKRVQDSTPLSSRNLEHDYTTAGMNLPNGVADFESPTTGPPLDPQARNLSNSASTLIERSTSPSSDGTLHKRSDENLLANGGPPSNGSNVLLHGLKTDGGSSYAVGNGTGPNSIPSLGGMDWDHPKQLLPMSTSSSIHDPGPPQGLKLKLPPVNVAHRQPPSYQLHMQQSQQQPNHNPPHHRIITSPQVENQRPPPPPYGQAGGNSTSGGNLVPQRRAKSFDRLLDSSPSDSSIPIHLPPLNAPQDTTAADSAPFGQQQHQQVLGMASSLQYGNPIVRPMTDGMATKNHPTASERRRTTLTVRLEKGEKGLGFRVKGLKSEQFGGGLFVQDLQPGGMAERYVKFVT